MGEALKAHFTQKVTVHALLNGSSDGRSDVFALQQEDGGHAAGLKEGSPESGAEVLSRSEVPTHTDCVRGC